MSCSADIDESNRRPSLSEENTSPEIDQCIPEENPETPSHLQSNPVVVQPQSSENQNDCVRNGSLSCPPGLEILAPIEQLFLKLKLEFYMGLERNIKFDIKDATGQIIFQANECSECFTRCCYGSNRPFNMKVFDFPLQREVMHFKRPCTFSGFCGPHFPESLKVSAVGQMFGRIEEDLDYPQFVVKNLFDEIVLRIEGPSCKHPTGGNVEFQIFSANGTQVSQISKRGSDLTHIITKDSDNFAIDFVRDLDVFMKAAIIGACIFIDSIFFERKCNNSE